MDTLFSDAAARLSAYPEMGKAGRIPGTRELIPHKKLSPDI
jgi:plasmid stabilization system protein ParE